MRGKVSKRDYEVDERWVGEKDTKVRVNFGV